jgi:hypothetical protein
MLSDVNPFRELAKFVRRPHFGRYAILLVHLLLLPVLAVVTEGHPKAELVAMVAEQVVFLGAVAALGGRRMFTIGAPLVVPGIVVLAVTFAVGEIPGDHYWFWAVARAVTFIVPIMTVGLLILVDVLAAKQIVFDLICGALCVFVLFGMCWANVYTLLERRRRHRPARGRRRVHLLLLRDAHDRRLRRHRPRLGDRPLARVAGGGVRAVLHGRVRLPVDRPAGEPRRPRRRRCLGR